MGVVLEDSSKKCSGNAKYCGFGKLPPVNRKGGTLQNDRPMAKSGRGWLPFLFVDKIIVGR